MSSSSSTSTSMIPGRVETSTSSKTDLEPAQKVRDFTLDSDPTLDVEPSGIRSELPVKTTLHLLPPSPSGSESSLTSEEIIFDHLAPASAAASTSTSGTANDPTIRNEPGVARRTNGSRGANQSVTPAATALGLRDLVEMHRNEKRRRAVHTSPTSSASVPVTRGPYGSRHTGPVEIRDSTSTNTGSGLISYTRANRDGLDPLPPAYDSGGPSAAGGAELDSSLYLSRLSLSDVSAEQTSTGVFAKQVVIRGWKVVGGGSWTDAAKMGAYVVYDIDIGLRNGGDINILRRYTDFVKLRSALKSRYPSLEQAIPPLPGKAHFSKFSPKFLEERQPRLQRFLRAVILHPEMGRGGEGSVVGEWILGGG